MKNKKIVIFFISFSMACLSMSGAFATSINSDENINNKNLNENYITIDETLSRIVNQADRFLQLDENYCTSQKDTEEKTGLEIPWINSIRTDLFEWWINIRYKGDEYSEKIIIPPEEFEEFLEKPLYMREYFFKLEDDNDPYDIQLKIGFYRSTLLNLNSNRESHGLTAKTIIRTWFPDGQGSGYGIDDGEENLEVWSEVRLNYGIFKDLVKSKDINSRRANFLPLMLNTLKDRFAENVFTLIQNIIDKLKLNQNQKNILTLLNPRVAPTMENDGDWVSLGMGYISTEGHDIPQLVEKRFTFAKDNIFSPNIFEQEMFPGGEDPYQIKFGFRSYNAGTTNPENPVYDIGFGLEFEPAVHMRTQYIPSDGYVFYHFDRDSQNLGKTSITYLADLKKGTGEDFPFMKLEFDQIDDQLARVGNWVSFCHSLKGFEYKASSQFNVGINVGLPDVFDEKVLIKGLPTRVKFEWGVSNTDFTIIPGQRFQFGLDVYAQLIMNGEVDKIAVFYPKSADLPDETPDSPFIEVFDIPENQRIDVGGVIDISNGSFLNVDIGGFWSLTNSNSVGGISVYYPKADWVNDPDEEFITLPQGLPSTMSASANVELNYKLGSPLDANNYFYGSVDHDCSEDIQEINVFLPDFDDPILRFTELPSETHSYAKLWWGQLKGEVLSSRGSAFNNDPIELDLEFGSFKIYDKIMLRDGIMTLRFRIGEYGYFYFDTTKNIFGNDLRFTNLESGDQMLLSVDEVSADDLQADWDISTTGDQLQINNLDFNGIIDTLHELELGLNYEGKTASLDLDWIVGEEGNFAIELTQDDDITLNFDDLFPEDSNFVMNGYITLSNQFNYDMEWNFDLGESAADPGFFRINKYNDHANLKNFNLYFTLKNEAGEEAYGIDIYIQNPKIYLDLEWYFDVDDIIPPYVYYWLDTDFEADVTDVNFLWTDLQGDHFWIEVI